MAFDGFSHVTARGNNRSVIFRDEADYEAFLRQFEKVVARFRWRCHAYCLIPNHYHLLVETPEGNLARGMLVLNGWYARRFNLRNERVGHVFGGPYDAKRVVTDEHLLEVSRYVVLNPVRAGLAAEPGRWRWSSYRATAGLSPRPLFLELDLVRELCGGPAGYRAFVADGMPSPTSAPAA